MYYYYLAVNSSGVKIAVYAMNAVQAYSDIDQEFGQGCDYVLTGDTYKSFYSAKMQHKNVKLI